MKPLCYIATELRPGPWGGGNQFLKMLKKNLKDYVTEDFKLANCVLFNSHHFLSIRNPIKFFTFFYLCHGKFLVHRVDGPIFSIREKHFSLDQLINYFSLSFAQGTIFQSNYSLIDSKKLGLTIPQKTKRIINAPDSDFFHQGELLAHQKIRLIMTSWSANKNKGFDFYQYLDENLDFSQYSAVFVGNSPFEFKNIKVLKPLDSSELAFELKISDLFLTASKNDPCSNSVLEALHCGLPVIALKSGGHPELIGEAGELFVTAAEMINKIELVAKNLSYYRKRIVVKKDREICAEYFEFFKDVVGSTRPYFFSFFKVLNLYTKLLLFKIKEKLSIRN